MTKYVSIGEVRSYTKKEEQTIKIMLSKGSYSIDQFNQLLTKNNEILSMQWKPPIIEN